jgi:Tfp pilus assembly protein PilF
MSLINQMLRDLESRNTANNAPSTLQRNIKVAQAPSSKMPVLIWSLLAITATGGTYWAYQYSKSLVKSPSAVIADNIKKEPVPAATFEKVLAAPNAVANEATAKTEQKAPENIPASPISETQPISVAKTVPATQPAPVLQPILATQTAPPTQPIPAVQTAPTIQPDPTAQSVPAAHAMPEVVADGMSGNTRPIKPKSPQPKQAPAKQRADMLYRQAEDNPEDASATVFKLEQALMLDPRHLKARLLLAKTLYNQGQIYKTAEFLDQSLALFPDNLQFINTRAQLYLQQKNPNGALSTLQRIDLANSSNETYLSLLAAAYQQQQSFANAAKVYQKLVNVNPEKAENWLGLALAQEKLGNPKLAREFYQQALSKNSLKESVASYVKQRLAELR